MVLIHRYSQLNTMEGTRFCSWILRKAVASNSIHRSIQLKISEIQICFKILVDSQIMYIFITHMYSVCITYNAVCFTITTHIS